MKQLVGVLVLCVLIVVGMHTIGGIGNRDQWKQASTYLTSIADGTMPEHSHRQFLELVKRIPDCRGNHSALAGLYATHALHMLTLGELGTAQETLAILKQGFVTEPLFAEHWREGNLTEPCKECGQTQQPGRCSTCKGSGRTAVLSSKLNNSRSRSAPRKKTCLACGGSGKASPTHTSCSLCRDRGSVISRTAVQEHLEKTLKKARVLAALKRLQCTLSLRPDLNATAVSASGKPPS